MKKTIFLLLTLTFFSPLSSQEEEPRQPSVFEALEMLIQKASQPGQEEVTGTNIGENEEDYQGEDPVLRLDEFEG